MWGRHCANHCHIQYLLRQTALLTLREQVSPLSHSIFMLILQDGNFYTHFTALVVVMGVEQAPSPGQTL